MKKAEEGSAAELAVTSELIALCLRTGLSRVSHLTLQRCAKLLIKAQRRSRSHHLQKRKRVLQKKSQNPFVLG